MTIRVLVLDDEETSRAAVARYLKTLGYSVDEASSSLEALGLLERRRYAAIVCDLDLGNGGSEGFDVIRGARERDAAEIVVVLTAFGSAEAQATAAALGVTHFLHKPQPLSAIAGVIAKTTNHGTPYQTG